MAKSPYLSEKSSDFDKIWYTKAYIEPDVTHVTKNWNFKNLKIAFLVITQQPIVRFQRNLYEEAERHADKDYMTKTANF